MIPPRVVRHVHVLLDILALLKRARVTDEKFGGGGRYEAEAYENNRMDLERAWQSIQEFEELCRRSGEDPNTVYAEHGRPERLSEAALAWLCARSNAPGPSA